ncbi:NFATC2-interacting protein isoform X2 [Artibeus jamaicensis]|uniref:NFATC2-interacting protein isoform X2 n=1 Tax=Artibeus jamaicensis TaxID=9417 RepID=UPI00187BC64C|nr:NFATC2-interacting protein isoform X2 [Artibeus jamaicensis]
MAEPVRKRGRWARGSCVGRGTRGARGGRGLRPVAQRSPARRSVDSVLVDLVSDSDEEIQEVSTAHGAADPVEVPLPECPGPAASRDDSDSDSEGADARPAGAPPALVKSSLHLIPDHLSLLKLCLPGTEEEGDMADSSSPHAEDPPVPDSPWKKKLRSKAEEGKKKKKESLTQDTSPLPPALPRTKSRKHTRALRKLREVNRRLQDLRSSLSPKQRQGQDHLSQDDEVVILEGPVLPGSPRLFPLKIRCRADLVRLPVRMSEPLQSVVDHMATHLGVSPSRILLLFGETELSPTATPRTLKLGVADIIDCVVLASSPEATETSHLLQLRVQGKEKHQMLEVSLSRDSPLKTLMSRYEEAMGLTGHKLSFFFDGTKLSGMELPADLDMESGDLIEVWS